MNHLFDFLVFLSILLQIDPVCSSQTYKYGDLLRTKFFSNRIPTSERRLHHKNRNFEIPGLLKYAPKQKDLKLKRLIKKLGEDFNDKWMSIERPLDVDESKVSISQDAIIDLELLKDFDTLNMTLTDSNNVIANVSDNTLELFKRWLLHHSTCNVHFVWTDIGSVFWPRWIRKGICSTEVSCSWPPGMTCIPTEGEVIRILRWNCRKGRRKGKKRRRKNKSNNEMNVSKRKRRERRGGIRCKWLKIPYSVNSKCICSC